ncbi:MAG: CHASE3 domain-containing protein, partial [Acidobacteriota bacterium]
MRVSVGAKIGAGFALALLIMIIIGAVSYQSASRMRADAEEVERTNKVFARLEKLYSTLPDAESGARGYVITGEDSYLDSYRLGIATLEQVLPELRQLIADPNQARRLNDLEPLIKEKFAFMKEIVDTRKEKGFTPAVQLVATGKGKHLMDEVRNRIAEISNEENTLMTRRSSESKASADRTKSIILYGVLAAFILLGVTAFLVTRNIAVPL